MRAEISFMGIIEAMPTDKLVAEIGNRAEEVRVIVSGFAYWW